MNKRFILISSIFILFLSLIVFTSFVFSKGGILDTFNKEMQIKELKDRIEMIKNDNKQKKEIIDKIKTDEGFRESLIKGLGINISEGEYVFKFFDQKDNIDLKSVSNQNHIFLYFIFSLSLFFIIVQVFVIFLTIFK
ncbi:MAG: hypothetical protein ACP5PT_02710 [Brevinematia bacterium]